ncbi:F-box only protein 36 isoform 3-T8 [Alca torda]
MIHLFILLVFHTIRCFYTSFSPPVKKSFAAVLLIQIAIVFGAKVLEHVLSLCQGNYDFLERLPVPLLLYIISFLELEDIARLSQVSRRFEMVCNSNALWENIVENLCDTITPEMKELAQEIGWKQFFFTNRLQLQLQLRRRRQKQDAQNKKGYE